MPAILALEQRGIEVLVPDSWAARELSGRIEPVTMNARQQHRHPGLQQLRERMRDPAVRARYARRKALVSNT